MRVLPKSTPPHSSTGTLELKATKENAHSSGIATVAFNPVDGKTIVSGSWDETIKVWEFIPFKEVEVEMTDDAMIVVTIDTVAASSVVPSKTKMVEVAKSI
jgi:WD40 repeat protein